MGLDITAYSRMAPCALHHRTEADETEAAWDMGHVLPYINPDFPEHAEHVQGCYQKTAISIEHGFRAGSYSGYNWWRDELAAMVPKGSRAFEELINFSDCEGTIGPNISRKLAADFARFQKHADQRQGDGTMFTAKYAEWRKAFEIASDEGFVWFH